MGLTLLGHASLPLKYWDHAFLTSVYLINRLATASLHFDIPFTRLHKAAPNFSFLRVFGCSCFPLLRLYNTHKLNFCSKECIFLGYSSSYKGYKCLSSEGRLYISKDVIFNELRFPHPTLFPLASPTPPYSTTVTPPLPLLVHPTPPLVPPPSPPDSLALPLQRQPSPPCVSSPSSPVVPSSSESPPSSGSEYVPSATTSSPSSPLPVVTRSRSARAAALLTIVEPVSVKDALASPAWKLAMEVEFAALQANKTCSLVPLPPVLKKIQMTSSTSTKPAWWPRASIRLLAMTLMKLSLMLNQ